MTDQPTPFVLLFEARSGSTFLIATLNSHPGVQAKGEILVGMDPVRQRRKALQALRSDDASATGPLAVGFKCKFADIGDFESFRSLLREVGAKIIYLYRENTVKRVVSMLNAIRLEKATGFWNLHKERDRLGPFEIEPEEFDLRLQKWEASLKQTSDYIASLELPTLELRYEEILTDIDDVTRRALRFLGVPYKPVEGRTLKATSDDLSQVIANFDELRSRYVGTRFEPMFDEVLAPNALGRLEADPSS